MSSVSIWLVALGIAIIAVVVGVLGNWLDRPSFVRWWHVVLALAVLVTGATALTLMQAESTPSSAPSTVESSGRSHTVNQLAPELAGRIILSIDDSAGYPALFASNADGSNRHLLWDIGSDFRPAAIPGSPNLVLSMAGAHNTIRLVVITPDGHVLRVLTHPAANQMDESAAVAGNGYVYFVRSIEHKITQYGGTLSTIGVMRVPLAGNRDVTRVVTAVKLSSVSVNDSGTVLAGICGNPKVARGPTQVCMVSLRTGHVIYAPGSTDASMDDVAISSNGRLVAYSSVESNPYGVEEVYVYNLRTGRTTLMTNLNGRNDQAAWANRSRQPCLLFHHYTDVSGSSIDMACLTPAPSLVPAIPIGQYPVWYGK